MSCCGSRLSVPSAPSMLAEFSVFSFWCFLRFPCIEMDLAAHCQGLSTAGSQRGLRDGRSNLIKEVFRVCDLFPGLCGAQVQRVQSSCSFLNMHCISLLAINQARLYVSGYCCCSRMSSRWSAPTTNAESCSCTSSRWRWLGSKTWWTTCHVFIHSCSWRRKRRKEKRRVTACPGLSWGPKSNIHLPGMCEAWLYFALDGHHIESGWHAGWTWFEFCYLFYFGSLLNCYLLSFNLFNCNADESATRVLACHQSRSAVKFPPGLKLVLSQKEIFESCSHLRRDEFLKDSRELDHWVRQPWNAGVACGVPLEEWLQPSQSQLDKDRLTSLGNIVVPCQAECALYCLQAIRHLGQKS